MERFPPDLNAFYERVYQAKKRWHLAQRRMSFEKKLLVMDELRESPVPRMIRRRRKKQ